MLPFVHFLPIWEEVCNHVDDKQSILLHAPRHYGKARLLQALSARFAESSTTICACLSSAGSVATGTLSYESLWRHVMSSTKIRSRLRVSDKSSFEDGLRTLAERTGSIALLLDGASAGNEANHVELIGLIHNVLRDALSRHPVNIVVVAVDDYSVFFHSPILRRASDWPFLQKMHFNVLDGQKLATFVTKILTQVDTQLVKHCDDICDIISSFCGGHAGLVMEMLRWLEKNQWKYHDGVFDLFMVDSSSHSHVLVSLAHSLEEDIEGYGKTAVEYIKPAFAEVNSTRVQALQQLGVLQRVSVGQVRLCPGAITRLIQQMNSSQAPKDRVGRIEVDTGDRRFQSGAMEISDDEFILIHLSDLHVGADYRHRLSWPGSGINLNAASAAELLSDDLARMGLAKRVDALVITGDLVSSGHVDEFRRAKDVIDEILEKLGLTTSNLAMIPGNHDVEWNPSPFSTTLPSRRVSLENYWRFSEALGTGGERSAYVRTIVSRNKMNRIELIGLDSNEVDDPEAGGIGFVTRETLLDANAALEANELRKEKRFGRLLLVHHHVLPCSRNPVDVAQSGRASVMTNATELLDRAYRWGVDAILHGHEHQPTVTVARRWPIDDMLEFKAIAVIGAGSFSVKRESLGACAKNHYYVIHVQERNINVRSRIFGDTGVGFVSHNDMAFRKPSSAGNDC